FRTEVVLGAWKIDYEVSRIEILRKFRVDEEVRKRCRRVPDVRDLREGKEADDHPIDDGTLLVRFVRVGAGLIRLVVDQQNGASGEDAVTLSDSEPADQIFKAPLVLLDYRKEAQCRLGEQRSRPYRGPKVARDRRERNPQLGVEVHQLLVQPDLRLASEIV